MSDTEIVLQDDISISVLDDVQIVSGGDNVVVVNSPTIDFASPWGYPEQWVTGHDYEVFPVTSIVTFSGSLYSCLLPHTSGVFADDLAAGKWLLFVSKGETGSTGDTGATGSTGPQGTPGTDVCGMLNGTIVESHAANAVTYSLKTRAGANPSAGDPVKFTFQNGSGSYDVVSVTSALSITIPSESTLGTFDAIPFRLWIAAFNDGGTVRLAAQYCTPPGTLYVEPEGKAVSTSQLPSNSSKVFCTAGVSLSSKYWCWIAYATYESGLTTAGLWNASPDVIVLVGATTPRPGTPIQKRSGGRCSGTYNGNNATTVVGTVTITPLSAANQMGIFSTGGNLYIRNFSAGGIAGTWNISRGSGSTSGIIDAAFEAYAAQGVDGPVFPLGGSVCYDSVRQSALIYYNHIIWCSSNAAQGVSYDLGVIIAIEYFG